MKRNFQKLKRIWRIYGRLIKLAAPLAILLLCAACTTSTKGSGTFCLIYRPIYADYDRDTPETIRQIDENNVVYEALCVR